METAHLYNSSLPSGRVARVWDDVGHSRLLRPTAVWDNFPRSHIGGQSTVDDDFCCLPPSLLSQRVNSVFSRYRLSLFSVTDSVFLGSIHGSQRRTERRHWVLDGETTLGPGRRDDTGFLTERRHWVLDGEMTLGPGRRDDTGSWTER